MKAVSKLFYYSLLTIALSTSVNMTIFIIKTSITSKSNLLGNVSK